MVIDQERTAGNALFNKFADLVGLGTLSLLILTLFGPVLQLVISSGTTDYPIHGAMAQTMAQTGELQTPHPLYHLLLITMHWISPNSRYETLALIVVIMFYLLLGYVLYYALRNAVSSATTVGAVGCALLSVALMLVTPITLLRLDQQVYLGYIGINVYHNPTMVLLKPLALCLFGCALYVFVEKRMYHRGVVIGASVLLTIGSTLAKPNFIICLVPALGFMALYRYFNKRQVDWWLMVCGIWAPALTVLAWQYWFTYTTTTEASRIIFAPFTVYRLHSGWLLPKFMLSILFPACVYLLYARQAWKSLYLSFAWIIFFFGAAYTYLLAESGPRMFHANFAWSGQIGLFLLFVMSTYFLMEQRPILSVRTFQTERRIIPFLICVGVFGLHLASGLLWYYTYRTTPWDPRW